MTPGRQEGFSLIEMLVAVAVLSIALGAALRAAGTHAAVAERLKSKTIASWVASNLAVEQRLGGENLGASERGGVVEMGGGTWYWRIRAIKTDWERMQRLDIEVSNERSMEAPLVRMAAYQGR